MCSVYSAGCSICCRAEACSQLDVSWDSGDRVIKFFSMWLLLIHSSGRAYRFICILQTVVVTIKKDLATFYGAEQVIDWSLKIDYFLTAACGLSWLNVNYMQNETAIQRPDCPNVWKWANLTHTSCTQSPKHEGSSVTSVPYNMLVTHTRARRVQVRGQRVSRLQLEQALPTQNPICHRMQKYNI